MLHRFSAFGTLLLLSLLCFVVFLLFCFFASFDLSAFQILFFFCFFTCSAVLIPCFLASLLVCFRFSVFHLLLLLLLLLLSFFVFAFLFFILCFCSFAPYLRFSARLFYHVFFVLLFLVSGAFLLCSCFFASTALLAVLLYFLVSKKAVYCWSSTRFSWKKKNRVNYNTLQGKAAIGPPKSF